MSKRKKQKARNFIMVFKEMLEDPEWRSLSSSAKVVWLYLRAKFNYRNLGEVSLTYSEMEGVMSSRTFSRSKDELEEKGWIEKKKQGGLYGGVCTYAFKGRFKDFYFKGRKI